MAAPTAAGPGAVENATPPGRFAHLAPLDGLRAIAVAAVMAFHTGAGWAVGGFLGVDVFFVLSGFLITVLLVKEWQRRGTVSLRRFYARRALRLLPAVALLCAFLLIVGPVGTGAAARNALWKAVAGTLFYFQNWQQAFHLIPILQLTDHTWSLAIEEQFYLVWPALLIGAMFLARRRGRHPLRAALALALVLAAVSALLKIVMWSGAGSQARIYYGTDTRADSLLIGAALAIAYAGGWLERARRQLPMLAPVAMLIIIVTFGFAHDNSSRLYQDGGLTAFALVCGVLIGGLVLAPAGLLGRVLAVAPLVWLGRISYGLYLWHWPVFRYLHEARLGLSWGPTQLVRIAVTLAAATISYYLLERPMLRLRHRFDPPADPPAAKPVAG
ncbi:MAG TPA: acyltransferase [Frankiaceae bacterium]|nr:acyltransferase [Frankiaceae bacterium]